MDFVGVALFLATATAWASLLGAVGALVARRRRRAAARRIGEATLVPLALSPLLLTTSFAVHLTFDHGPGTAEPMGLTEFLRVHPVFVVHALVITGATVLLGTAVRDEWRDVQEQP